MKKALYLAIFAALLLACPARSQDTPAMAKRFTNQDVIGMAQLGLSDEVIVAKIRSLIAAAPESVSFDTSVEGLKALKAANVSDSVIRVMINPALPMEPVATSSGPVTFDPNLPPPEVGVYWKDQARFVLIQGETLTNAKVGGKAGSFFTDGMRNEHWDAYLEGQVSKNIVREHRPVFYFYVPEGAFSSDYSLIRLNKKGDHREFQVGSFGGIAGGKSGVLRDKELPFKAEHVGLRTYRITLDEDLKPGPYAFFMGTGQSATIAGPKGNRSGGAAAGRIFDFNIPE